MRVADRVDHDGLLVDGEGGVGGDGDPVVWRKGVGVVNGRGKKGEGVGEREERGGRRAGGRLGRKRGGGRGWGWRGLEGVGGKGWDGVGNGLSLGNALGAASRGKV